MAYSAEVWLSRQFGWKHYSSFLGRILTNKEEVLRIMPEEMKSLRIYDYAKRVSEAVTSQRGRQ